MKEVQALIEKAAGKLKVERITLRSKKTGKIREFVAKRMPYPFDGWYYRDSKFYVPARYDKGVKRIVFRKAKHKKALTRCKVLFEKLFALSA